LRFLGKPACLIEPPVEYLATLPCINLVKRGTQLDFGVPQLACHGVARCKRFFGYPAHAFYHFNGISYNDFYRFRSLQGIISIKYIRKTYNGVLVDRREISAASCIDVDIR